MSDVRSDMREHVEALRRLRFDIPEDVRYLAIYNIIGYLLDALGSAITLIR